MLKPVLHIAAGIARLAAVICLSSVATIASAQVSGAEKEKAEAEGPLRFTGGYWSQIYPNRDFNRGCAVGYLSFEFMPAGYFIFNRKIHGSWRIDELGNLKLRTKDGKDLTLMVSNNTVLRPTTDLNLIKRANLYQKCPQ